MIRLLILLLFAVFMQTLYADSTDLYSLCRIKVSATPDSSYILNCRIDRTSISKKGGSEFVETLSLSLPEYKFKESAVEHILSVFADAPSQQLSLKLADVVLTFEQKPGLALHVLSGKQTDSGFHLTGSAVFSVFDDKSQKILLYPFDAEFKLNTVYYILPQANRYPEPIQSFVDIYLNGINKDIPLEELKKYPVKF